MEKLKVSLIRENEIVLEKEDIDEVYLVYTGLLKSGDVIKIDFPVEGFYRVNLDDALKEVDIYAHKGVFLFPIPFDRAKDPYNPNAFLGDKHLFYVSKSFYFDKNTKRNLALNPYDIHSNSTIFPHSSANVETRGESVFFSRNAIDGVVAASGHGKWPYSSWGINRDPNAKFFLDFGREVRVEGFALYLRSDFPHDSFWTSVKITLKGKEGEKSWTFNTVKKDGRQEFKIDSYKAKELELSTLVKNDDESPFPALTQLEVIGRG